MKCVTFLCFLQVFKEKLKRLFFIKLSESLSANDDNIENCERVEQISSFNLVNVKLNFLVYFSNRKITNDDECNVCKLF